MANKAKTIAMNKIRYYSTALILALSALCLTKPYSFAEAPAGEARRSIHEVVDMAGRKVILPTTIRRIMTVGAVPVLNSFIFVFGDGDKIVNGLPINFNQTHYSYQLRFAPSLANKPRIEVGQNPNPEEIVALAPDVIFTMDRIVAEKLAAKGFAVIFLSWRQPEDVKHLLRLVGLILNKPLVSERYARYFDQTVARVSANVSQIPLQQRRRVLFCNIRHFSTDHLITEWWIETAGGRSVTNNGRQAESVVFTLEQVLVWNPDILFVPSLEDKKALSEEPRFAVLKAVQTGQVYVVPTVAHLWAHRTIEEPLTLLWAAKTLYPDRFHDLNMTLEMQRFYSEFLHYRMTDREAQTILEGAHK